MNSLDAGETLQKPENLKYKSLKNWKWKVKIKIDGVERQTAEKEEYGKD